MSVETRGDRSSPRGEVSRPAGDGDRLALPGGRWSIWPQACLRATGFPVAHVLDLASDEATQLAVRVLQTRNSAARAMLRTALADEHLRVRGVLRGIARDRRFREAVMWQNPHALRQGVERLAAAAVERRDKEMREKSLLVASYVQRYSAKNDTIGFFGPAGWARLSDGATAATVACGPSLVAERQVYFEQWGIDEVARTFDRRDELRPWGVPRVPAYVRLDETRVMIGPRVVAELSPDQAALFAACDGARNASVIARLAQFRWSATFPTAATVYAVLQSWQRDGYLLWTFEGPQELHPEHTLRARVAVVDDEPLRAEALEVVDELERGRAHIAAAAGDPEALDHAMAALESSFSRITGNAATRAHGQMYAARTLVYEDCRRDAVVEFGADVLRRLGPPLSLVLHSARWAVHELARRHAAEFRRIYATLSSGGRHEVTLGAFFAKTSLVGRSDGSPSPMAAEVRAALQQRWADVLGAPPSARAVQFRSHDLRARVWAAFPSDGAPPSGWASYLSPDVMIDAANVEAIRAGAYQFVLGELHIANTLAKSALLTLCPERVAIARALDRDCPPPRVFWLAPKQATTQRVQYTLKPNDYVYVASDDPSPVPPDRTLRVGDLVVADDGDEVTVRTRDGRLSFPGGEFFGYLALRREINLFSALATQGHRPRVTIDDLVLCREQWQFAASELEFASRGDELDRFVECHRWIHQRGIPRFVFVRTPGEIKPVYCDFRSPLFIDLLSRAIRRARRDDASGVVTITEMLPTPAGAWLGDADGHRYTSELRLVLVDPAAAEPERRTPGASHAGSAAACVNP